MKYKVGDRVTKKSEQHISGTVCNIRISDKYDIKWDDLRYMIMYSEDELIRIEEPNNILKGML